MVLQWGGEIGLDRLLQRGCCGGRHNAGTLLGDVDSEVLLLYPDAWQCLSVSKVSMKEKWEVWDL